MENLYFEKVQAKHRKANTVFWVCIFLLPITCIVPCPFGFLIEDKALFAVFFTSYATVFLVTFIGLITAYFFRRMYTHILKLLRFADHYGLEYVASPAYEEIEFLPNFKLFQGEIESGKKVKSAFDLIKGKVSGFNFFVTNYLQLRKGKIGGKNLMLPFESTVFMVKDLPKTIPNFLVFPKTWKQSFFDAIMGIGGVRVTESKEFNGAFNVFADKSSKLGEIFSTRIIKLCLEERNCSIEVKNNSLVVCEKDKSLPAERYEELLGFVLAIAKALTIPET